MRSFTTKMQNCQHADFTFNISEYILDIDLLISRWGRDLRFRLCVVEHAGGTYNTSYSRI